MKGRAGSSKHVRESTWTLVVEARMQSGAGMVKLLLQENEVDQLEQLAKHFPMQA